MILLQLWSTQAEDDVIGGGGGFLCCRDDEQGFVDRQIKGLREKNGGKIWWLMLKDKLGFMEKEGGIALMAYWSWEIDGLTQIGTTGLIIQIE